MKKAALLLFVTLIFAACGKVSKEDTQKLNGFWEIEKVVLADGSEKEYTINTNYDFFEIDSNYKGFRKKATPTLDGKFQSDDSFETVEITEQDGKIYLNYKTDYASWQEELQSISDEKMVVLNKQKLEYHYKKAKPFFDGEEIK